MVNAEQHIASNLRMHDLQHQSNAIWKQKKCWAFTFCLVFQKQLQGLFSYFAIRIPIYLFVVDIDFCQQTIHIFRTIF